MFQVETSERKKKAMWKEIRAFLSKPLFVYSKPGEAEIRTTTTNHENPYFQDEPMDQDPIFSEEA